MRKTAIEIIKIINKAGYQAYFAGGCVRDILLQIEPKDYDIVTSAKPEEIEKILPKTYTVGKQFGVIVAVMGKFKFEIATFRGEGKYLDRRRPSNVFWSSAEEDAKRRDFTINGMFYNPLKDEIIDYVNGRKDLNDKILRFIGNPNDRIKEDYLRILRAIRFKNTHGFEYEPRTWQAIKNNAYLVEKVSGERIREELNKMFLHSSRAEALLDLSESDLLKYILPEVEKMKGVPQPDQYHKEGDVFAHTYYSLKSLPKHCPLYLVWATLLHDSGKPATLTMPKNKNDRIRFNKHVKYSAGIASLIARRLKFPNYERRIIVWLVKNHMMVGDIPKMTIANQRRFLMHPWFPSLLALTKADSEGMQPVRLDLYKKDLKLYKEAQKLLKEEKKKPKHKLILSGNDIMSEFKLDSSPQIGKLMKLAEDAQLEGKITTKKEALKYLSPQIKKR